jgi:hypothetical protein
VPAWILLVFMWPAESRAGEPVGMIWVAHLQEQPLHWLGENGYVPAVLVTMLLATRWLRRAGRVAARSTWRAQLGGLADAR